MIHPNEPYILIAQQDWHGDLGSNARNMAMEISKSHPVLYVNPPLDLNTIIKHGRKQQVRNRVKSAFNFKKMAEHVAPNIWVHMPATICVSINWMKNKKLFDIINQTNAHGFFKSVIRAIKLLGWRQDNCIVLNDSQMFVGLHINRFLSPKKNFYYIRDNLVEHPYFKRHGSHVEPLTIKNATAVFANSAYLADYAQLYNKQSLDIGQGCELEMYNAENKMQEPKDLSCIPHPRIGYTGFLTGERLDIALLEELATKKPGWQWVLIGPEEIMFRQSTLHTMSNVHFLGAKKTTELPSYLMHLDVCINPQLVNQLTIGNYPRKIDEYLAMGKPVVATNTPAMKMFLPHVHLAIGASNYVTAIETSLKDQTLSKTIAAIDFAKSHTWKNCVDKIFKKQIETQND